MFSGADSVRLGWLLAAVWCAVAIVVVVVYGPQHLSRKHRKQEESVQPEVSTTSPRCSLNEAPRTLDRTYSPGGVEEVFSEVHIQHPV